MDIVVNTIPRCNLKGSTIENYNVCEVVVTEEFKKIAIVCGATANDKIAHNSSLVTFGISMEGIHNDMSVDHTRNFTMNNVRAFDLNLIGKDEAHLLYHALVEVVEFLGKSIYTEAIPGIQND